ncbi:MAG: alpha-ketoacid dehydrogenase subunit beta [Dehalococcoidia bacterium]|jgi:pyruvate dehydrogenase E1 component beta subunit|nr:alpha-ketoacid dehydrogenase subunit beta [Dehalococcoidia bacterium]
MKDSRYIRAISEGLAEELDRDGNVLVLGEDVVEGGPFSVTKGLVGRFGTKRIRNTPISESAFMGLALGAAIAGLRPVVEVMFMDFLTVCMDPLVNHAAKMRYMFGGQYSVPLVVLTAAGAGGGAGPHHSQSLEAWFAHIPGLKVIMPSTPYDAKGLLKAAIRDDDPVIYVYHKGLLRQAGQMPEKDFTVPIGVADIKREGTDITIVATGLAVHQALSAAVGLQEAGVSAEVVDPRTISPLDTATIVASVKKTGRLVVAHEAVKGFGIGAEVAAVVAEEALDYLDAPIKRIGLPSTPIPFSPTLEAALLPTADDIGRAAREACGVAVEQ